MRSLAIIALGFCALAPVAHATAPKLDPIACAELRVDYQKSVELGLLADYRRGPAWAKANLTPERMRDIELFIQLDEQVKFGCRDAKVKLEAPEPGTPPRQQLDLTVEPDPVLDPGDPGKVNYEEDGDPAADAQAIAPGGPPGVVVVPSAVPEAGPNAVPVAPPAVKPQSAVTPQKKSKPKRKADDAYSASGDDIFTPLFQGLAP